MARLRAIKLPPINMNTMNNGFSFCFFALSAIIGSVSSFFLTSAFVWALVRLWQKKITLVKNYQVERVAAVFALYPATEILSLIVNQRGFKAVPLLAGSLLFLSVLPVLSRLMVSSPGSIVNSVGLGAAFSSILVFVYSLTEYLVFGQIRAEAGLGNAAVMAAFALSMCCICLCLLPVIAKKWRHYLIAGFMCSLGAIIMTGTRTVWLAAPIVVAFSGWHLVRKPKLLKFNLRILPIILTAALFFPVALYLIYSRIALTVTSFQQAGVFTTDASIGQRLFLWRGGWEQAKGSWLFGYGPDSPPEMIVALGGEAPLHYSHYHNFLLTSLIRGGILELIAVLMVFGVLIWVALQRSTNDFQAAGRRLLIGLVLATSLPALAGILFPHDIITAVFLYTAIIGLCLSIAKPEQAAET